MDNLLYKKGTLLYKYVFEKYIDYSDKYSDKIFEVYNKFVNDVKDEFLTFEFEPEIDRNFLNNIDVTFNIDNYKDIIEKIVRLFLDNNKEKIIILFMNSEIFQMDLSKYDNVYLFDIGKIYQVEKYNLLSVEEIENINFEMLIDYLTNNLPFDIKFSAIQSAVQSYLQFFIYFDIIVPENIYEYIFSMIMNKIFSLSQIIDDRKLKIDNKLKSFLENL